MGHPARRLVLVAVDGNRVAAPPTSNVERRLLRLIVGRTSFVGVHDDGEVSLAIDALFQDRGLEFRWVPGHDTWTLMLDPVEALPPGCVRADYPDRRLLWRIPPGPLGWTLDSIALADDPTIADIIRADRG